MQGRLLAALALSLLALPASAANLDVSASYRMRGIDYRNLNLDKGDYQSRQSFLQNDARLGLGVRRIYLEARDGEDVTMDVAVGLRALGVTGSSATLRGPFDRAARFYPDSEHRPFIENAYARVHNFWGKPLELTFGRQSYRLGSGLLLDDDGAGLTGVSARAALPWWGMRVEGFVFGDRNPQYGGNLALYGMSVDLPTEGTWQLNQLFERDRANQPIYGCSYQGMPAAIYNCEVSTAKRSFTSLRYQISYGPLVFDGEAAMQKGSATPTGPEPAPNHITYNGNAQVVKAKWKQRLPRLGEGIMRVSVARGTGDKPETKTTDEAFFPSHGHRYNGLERSGFGEFFAATPYDAYGGNYSSSTASGLRQGASGIMVVGAGFTPPAWRGVALDMDFFLYQAERVRTGGRTLGTEQDFRLRYNVEDRFVLAVTAAFFKAGDASGGGMKGRKYALEAFARF